MSPPYEQNRLRDAPAFYRKLKRKRQLNRWVGEVYVGRRAKLAYLRRWLERLPLAPDAAILEAGSGDGCFAFYMARRFPQAQITGVELNAVEAEVCEQIAREEGTTNLCFVCGDLGEARFAEQFYFAYCLDVLEHITDDIAALQTMYGALLPGGSLLVHVPSRYNQQWNGTLVTVPDADAWRINPGHVRNGYTPDELRDKLTQAGFIVREIEPTQARPMTCAHWLYARVERVLPLRVLILPVLDVLIWLDARRPPAHGNTLWAWAQRPEKVTHPQPPPETGRG